MNIFSLEGKIAWVTGASYGIGFAIAEALANAGTTIVFNDINEELMNKGLAVYAEKGIEAFGYVCNVTDEKAGLGSGRGWHNRYSGQQRGHHQAHFHV